MQELVRHSPISLSLVPRAVSIARSIRLEICDRCGPALYSPALWLGAASGVWHHPVPMWTTLICKAVCQLYCYDCMHNTTLCVLTSEMCAAELTAGGLAATAPPPALTGRQFWAESRGPRRFAVRSCVGGLSVPNQAEVMARKNI